MLIKTTAKLQNLRWNKFYKSEIYHGLKAKSNLTQNLAAKNCIVKIEEMIFREIEL